MITIEIYHPGEPYPVRLVETVAPWNPERTEFAVYRPARSARGGTRNAARLIRPDLAKAYALACKPIQPDINT